MYDYKGPDTYQDISSSPPSGDRDASLIIFIF